MRVDRRPGSNMAVMPVAVKCCCPEQVAGYIVVDAGCKLHGWGSGVAERNNAQSQVKVTGRNRGAE